MSLIKVRVLEFQNNSYFDESPHLGKTLLLPLSNVTESKSFEKMELNEVILVKLRKNSKFPMKCELLSNHLIESSEKDGDKEVKLREKPANSKRNATNSMYVDSLAQTNSKKSVGACNSNKPSSEQPDKPPLTQSNLKKPVKNSLEQSDKPPLLSQSTNIIVSGKKKSTDDNDGDYLPSECDSEETEEDDQSPGNSKENEPTTKKTSNKIIKKKGSNVQKTAKCHEYFKTIELDGCLYDICQIKDSFGKICGAKFKNHNSTTRMNEHLGNIHELKQFNRSKSVIKKVISDTVRGVVYFVISSASPFLIVENEYLKFLVERPDFKLPSRKVIKDMLCKVYDEIYDDIKGKLAAIDYLAVTTDGWTANYQKKCYLSLTAHYIDDNFEFKTYKLGIHQIDKHDHLSTAKKLENKMKLFGIFEKVNFMAVDNAAVMTKACKKLKKEFVGCFLHMMNLIVKRFFNSKLIIGDGDEEDEDEDDENEEAFYDLFQEQDSDDDDDEEEEDPQPYHSEQIKALVTVGLTLKKVKKIVKLFNKSLQLRELLIARTQLTLINDIKIRWNYTLLMINRYLELYDDVIDIVTNSTKHEKIYKKHFLTEDDIDLLNCLSALLKPFYTVTQILSGDTYITIDKVLHSILYIRDKINKFNPDESVPIQKILKDLLLESFNFYAAKYKLLDNVIYMSAALLSPKFKYFYFATQTEKEKFIKFGESNIKKIWDDIKNDEKPGDLSTPISTRSNSSFFGEDFTNDSIQDREIENELNLIRLERFTGDLSSFWRMRKNQYPKLYSVARRVFCCPGSSISSEQLFSKCSDQMWAKRNRLGIDSFEKIMFIKTNI